MIAPATAPEVPAATAVVSLWGGKGDGEGSADEGEAPATRFVDSGNVEGIVTGAEEKAATEVAA